MKHKKTVAVIDSGVDMSDLLLRDAEIEDLYYEDGELKHNFQGNLNMHGTEIIKVLLKECSDINIISIRTLRENNKCMMSDIINAIKYCIEINVDIINLSLGSCSAIAKRIDMLKDVCEEAIKKGIVIFAADHNIPGMKSYPANFEFVIGVTTSDNLEDICHVYYKDRIVEFSENFVYVPDREKCIIRRGNSYLCPLITGIFCNFIDDRDINENAVYEFMDFIEVFSKKKNASKIFFDKNSSFDKFLMKDKKVLFFTDDMDLNNIHLYNMYREICNIKLCYDDIYEAEADRIATYINEADVFFIGALSNQFICENKEYMKVLTKVLEKKSQLTVTVFPIVDTYHRLLMTLESDFQLKSIYK